jgi:hypothetical protein
MDWGLGGGTDHLSPFSIWFMNEEVGMEYKVPI